MTKFAPNIKLGMFILLGVVIVVAGSHVVKEVHKNALRKQCTLRLRNYNITIRSFGIYSNCYELWADPDLTKDTALKGFGERLPECPSGGTCKLVYGRGEFPNMPKVICSLEESHGHGPAYDY